MSGYWLGQENLLEDGQLEASSTASGVVGYPVKIGTSVGDPGAAAMLTQGGYTGPNTRTYTVEIDSIASGAEVGSATFRWKHSDSSGWEATGVVTSASWLTLENGVQIKWTSGTGDDFASGDQWVIACSLDYGLASLTLLNRDRVFRSNALDSPNWIDADLGADHDRLLLSGPLRTDDALDVGAGTPTVIRASSAYNLAKNAGAITAVSHNTGRWEVNDRNLIAVAAREGFDDAFWVKSGATITTDSADVYAPNHTPTADKMVEGTGSGEHREYNNDLSGLADDTEYALSVYLKAGTRSAFVLGMKTKAGNYPYAVFDLDSGVVAATGNTGYVASAITDVGGGWYRCSLVVDIESGTATPTVYLYMANAATYAGRSYQGDGKSYLYLWGAQLEQAVNSAATVYARFAKPMRLMEPKAANTFAPENLDWSAWSQTYAAFAAGQTDPSGGTEAAKLTDLAGDTNNYATCVNDGLADGTAQSRTVTAYFKRGAGTTGNHAFLGDGAHTNWYRARFSLITGRVVDETNCSAKVTPVGDWFRVEVTYTLLAGESSVNRCTVAVGLGTEWSYLYTADGSYLYVAWIQIEESEFGTSYIPPYNHFGHSEDLTDADWTPTNLTAAASGDYDPPDEVAGVTVHKLTDTSDGAVASHILNQFGSISAGQQLQRFYVRQGTKTTTQISLYNATDGVVAKAVVDLTDGSTSSVTGTVDVDEISAGGWYRVTMYGTGTAASDTYIFIGSAGYTGDGTGTIYVCAPQAEQGVASARDYWPTEDNAYRAADELKWPISGNFDQDKGTAVLGWVPKMDEADIAADEGLLSVQNAVSSLLYWDQSTGLLGSHDGTTEANSGALTLVSGRRYIAAVRWWNGSENCPSDEDSAVYSSGRQIGCSVDGGVSWVWGGIAAYDGEFTEGSYINLAYGIAYPGLFSDLRIFDDALTEAEVEAGVETLDNPASPEALVILDHNFSSSAVVKLQANNTNFTDDWENPEYEAVLDYSADRIVQFISGRSYRYWRLAVFDPANPDGYIELGELFLGTGLTPQGVVDLRQVERRRLAREAGRRPREAFGFTFVCPTREAKEEFRLLFDGLYSSTERRLRPTFFIWDRSDPDSACWLVEFEDQTLTSRQIGPESYEIPLNLTEVKITDVS